MSTGTDGNGHKIAISGGGEISRDGKLTVAGAGTVVADYCWTVDGGYTTCTMPITVTDTATLAMAPGANLGTGKISVASGATLQVALVSNETSQVAFDHSLNLADGAVLGFTFAENDFACSAIIAHSGKSLPAVLALTNIYFPVIL